MHVVRVIKCGGRAGHTCCEGTTHICMRNNVSRLNLWGNYCLLCVHIGKCTLNGLKSKVDINLQEAYNLHEMFRTRYSLHKRAYQHKVVKGVELM